MRHTLLLAWRYLSFHRVRTALLVACIALTFLLPLAVELLVGSYATRLAARAAATPFVVGAKGSRYDLVLSSLYFRGRVPSPLSMAEVELVRDGGLADVIPILARAEAHGFPVVGTSHDYYAFRGLEPASGTPPLFLGDAVLGAGVARELGLVPGDTLLSDQGSLYDLSLVAPLRMRVVGVLAEHGGPDDRAVFVDVKTAWILEGIGHGHAGALEDPAAVQRRDEDAVVLNAAVRPYTEITPENIDTFHFHGDPDDFPLTALFLVPHDAKSATLLKGRYRVSRTAQLLEPTVVVDEVLGFVFELKAFFDANVLLVSVSTALLLALIVTLSIRLRQRELQTLFRIGCARAAVVRLVAVELALVLLLGALATALAAWLVVGLLAHLEVIP